MIKSLNDRMSYDTVYPNSTLRPDWDLLEEITTVYRQFPVKQVTFEWVKGHQDSLATHTELPPQALFNIRADTIANEFTQSQGMTLCPQSPLLPSTRCHLTINGTTITGKYRHSLRLSVAEPALFDYLARRHQWDPHVIDTIDWEAFCMAARTYSSTEVHLLKLVHDKLPLRRQVSRHQSWTNAQCHYCSSYDTMDHLQTSICNPMSPKFRSMICKSVQHYLSRRQCPQTFSQRFMNTLQSWIDPLHPMVNSDQHPPEQVTIGLRLITRGFLSQSWRRELSAAITASSPSANEPNDHELTSTIAGLIRTMWTCVGQLWLDHLTTIHETAKSTQSPVTLASLRERVRLIHALQPNTLPIHAHYFHSDLDDFLEKATIQSLTSYTTHYLPAILRSLKLARSTTTHDHSDNITCPLHTPLTSPLTSPTHQPRQSPPNSPSHSTSSPFQSPSSPIDTPTASTTHPAMEETPHRKRNRRRIFIRTLQVLRTWARRRWDPTTT